MLAASWTHHWTPLNSISLISTFRCLFASINTPELPLIQICPVPSQDSVLYLDHHLFAADNAAHNFYIPNQFFFYGYQTQRSISICHLFNQNLSENCHECAPETPWIVYTLLHHSSEQYWWDWISHEDKGLFPKVSPKGPHLSVSHMKVCSRPSL